MFRVACAMRPLCLGVVKGGRAAVYMGRAMCVHAARLGRAADGAGVRSRTHTYAHAQRTLLLLPSPPARAQTSRPRCGTPSACTAATSRACTCCCGSARRNPRTSSSGTSRVRGWAHGWARGGGGGVRLPPAAMVLPAWTHPSRPHGASTPCHSLLSGSERSNERYQITTSGGGCQLRVA